VLKSVSKLKLQKDALYWINKITYNNGNKKRLEDVKKNNIYKHIHHLHISQNAFHLCNRCECLIRVNLSHKLSKTFVLVKKLFLQKKFKKLFTSMYFLSVWIKLILKVKLFLTFLEVFTKNCHFPIIKCFPTCFNFTIFPFTNLHSRFVQYLGCLLFFPNNIQHSRNPFSHWKGLQHWSLALQNVRYHSNGFMYLFEFQGFYFWNTVE